MEILTDTKSTVALFSRAHSQLRNSIFHYNHHHELCIFIRNEQEAACRSHKNLFQQRWPTVTVTTTETRHPPHHCAHIHCLVQQVLNEFQWEQFFSAWRNSMTHLCFICTSMSNTILSDCPSAAICNRATTRDHRITDSQNGLAWMGPLRSFSSNLPAIERDTSH